MKNTDASDCESQERRRLVLQIEWMLAIQIVLSFIIFMELCLSWE